MTGGADEPTSDEELPCRSAMRKLERAGQHLQALGASVEAFRQRETYRIELVGNLADEYARYVEADYVFSEIEAFPDEWSAIASDFLNNLRSALDHAVWELATSNVGGEPPNPGAVCFPICATRAEFDRVSKRAIASLSPRHAERVRAVQPFSTPPPDDLTIDHHPLLLLHHLNRIDKHRTLHIVRRWLAAFDLSFDPEPPELSVCYSAIDDLVDQSVLASARFLRPPPEIAAEGLPTVRTIAHQEVIAGTSHTPEVPMGGAFSAMYRSAVNAVFILEFGVQQES